MTVTPCMVVQFKETAVMTIVTANIVINVFDYWYHNQKQRLTLSKNKI